MPVASKWTKYATGLSLWHHKRIKEFTSAEAKKDADQLLQAKYELMELMRQTGWGKKGGLRARSIHTRMEGVHRFSRAGTDPSTSPAQLAPDHPETVWSQAEPEHDFKNEAPINNSEEPEDLHRESTEQFEDADTSATSTTGIAVRRFARSRPR